jgi:hypothetical protein
MSQNISRSLFVVLIITLLAGFLGSAHAESRIEIADDKFLQEVAMVESGGNPNAVSHAGAQGKYQIMPHTARDPGFGVKPIDNPFDPEKAKRFAQDYWNALFKACDMSYECAVLSYNWGIGNYRKWVRLGRPMSMIPEEARGYLAMLGDDARAALKRYKERKEREEKENRRLKKLASLQQNPDVVVSVDGTRVPLYQTNERPNTQKRVSGFSVLDGQFLLYRRKKTWLTTS